MRSITRLLIALSIGAAIIAATGVASTAFADPTPTPPTVTIGDLDRVVGPDVDIAFEASVGGVTVQCQLDNNAYVTCESPWHLTDLDAGRHIVRMRAVDGDTTGPVSSVRFTVDAQGPTVRLSRPASVTGPNVSLSFNAFDISGIDHFDCKLDNGYFEACTSPAELKLQEGQHTFTVRATDSLGNVGPEASATWTVDATPPDTNIVISPPNETTSHTARFVFSAGEQNRTFECSLDDGPFARCDSPKTYTNLSSGEHTFTVRAVDKVGNVDPTPAEVTWHIDATGPT